MAMDQEFLNQALELARSRKGYTFPNPAVGAVLVKNGIVTGQGFHWGAGAPHAEVEALKNIGMEAEGATLYVTLEPCCHYGKTPPCTELLKSKKIERVVYGFCDPNPVVFGKGARILEAAGIKVELLGLESISLFYRSYAWWVKTKKTWMTGKIALSQDGKVSLASGKPVKITGALADDYTHLRRSEADVIVTSVATLKADNPRLDARVSIPPKTKPVWVLDRDLEFSSDFQILKTAASVHLVHGKTGKGSLGLDCIELPEKDKKLVLESLPLELGMRGYHEAWVEVGPTLFSAFMREQIFQEVVLYQSSSIEIIHGKEAFLGARDSVFQGYRKVAQEKMGTDLRESWFLK